MNLKPFLAAYQKRNKAIAALNANPSRKREILANNAIKAFREASIKLAESLTNIST